MPPSPERTTPRPIVCLIDGVRLRHVTRGYMSLLRGDADRFSRAPVGSGQQKSRINKDPAEFDWKCRLRLTSRGEHSRALMGGERAQEMIYICAHHAQETSIYFATHACKKTQAVVQPIPERDRTSKIARKRRAARPKPSRGHGLGPILLHRCKECLMARIQAHHVYFNGRRA